MPRHVSFLLPDRAKLTPVDADSRVASQLRQADSQVLEPGWRAQLLRHFDVLPRGLAVAAITRQVDCGDALGNTWLRADPVCMQADMSTGRLMAHGNIDLSDADCDALLQPLKPLFGDEGFPISRGSNQRWYLQMPAETSLPEFVDPVEGLGADLGDCLPPGASGQRWRRLFNEAQVVLHNHPLNSERRAQGRAPINALWFWGAGRLPDSVRSIASNTVTSDPLLRGLVTLGGATLRDIGAFDLALEATRLGSSWLIDLRDRYDAGDILNAALQTLGKQIADGDIRYDFADGQVIAWRRRHRLRFWRRAR